MQNEIQITEKDFVEPIVNEIKGFKSVKYIKEKTGNDSCYLIWMFCNNDGVSVETFSKAFSRRIEDVETQCDLLEADGLVSVFRVNGKKTVFLTPKSKRIRSIWKKELGRTIRAMTDKINREELLFMLYLFFLRYTGSKQSS